MEKLPGRAVLIHFKDPTLRHLSRLKEMLPPTVSVRQTDQEDDHHTYARVRESDFGRLKAIRADLTDHGVDFAEQCQYDWRSTVDTQQGSLLLLQPRVMTEVKFRSESPFDNDYCEGCGRHHLRRLRENAHHHLALSAPGTKVRFREALWVTPAWGTVDTPGRTKEEEYLLLSTWARDLLIEVGYHTGLEFFPVKIDDFPDHVFYGLHPTKSLDYNAAPYGSLVEPCDACGVHTARYGFYPVHPKPKDLGVWYASPYLPARPIMVGGAFRWLHDLPMIRKDGGLPFEGRRLGWSPDEVDSAFLEERFR